MRERETWKDEAARHCTKNTAYAAPNEYALTPETTGEEIVAPVSEVFQLLIVESESNKQIIRSFGSRNRSGRSFSSYHKPNHRHNSFGRAHGL